MAKKTDDNIIVSLYGLDIKKDTLYEIVEKKDHNAPQGFQEFNTTKILSTQFSDSKAGAIFDVDKGIWDTGLYDSSKAFNQVFGSLTPEGKKLILNKLSREIIVPYEKEKGEGKLNHTTDNNKFWDEYQIKLTRGRVFDTSKTEDLLNLYLLLIHRRLTPKDMESSPLFKQPISDYIVIGKEDNKGKQIENAKAKMKATTSFTTLLEQDKQTMVDILDYLGINCSMDTDEDVLITLFDKYLENKEDKNYNVNEFNRAIEFASTEKGKETLFTHRKLKEFYRKNNGTVTFKRGQVFIEGTYVENGWKNAADKIQSNEEFKTLFENLL